MKTLIISMSIVFVFLFLVLADVYTHSKGKPTRDWLQGYDTGVNLTEQHISNECDKFGVFYIGQKAYECKEQP